MQERLQKLIAAAGVASRRKAEELIQEGRVSVNGEIVTVLGTKASVEDDIRVDGKPLKREEKVYYMMNKPKYTVCTLSDDRGRDTVMDYMKGVKERIFPVGRLDFETTGLLLLTNDGDFANAMMHPRYHLPKTYDVTVDGIFTVEMAKSLQKGIELEDGMTLPSKVQILAVNENKKKTNLKVTIFEGRNREVRRMMEYFKLEVSRLERISFGFLDYGTLRQGEFRKMKRYEIKKLIDLAVNGEENQ